MNRRDEFAVRIFAGILASDDDNDVDNEVARAVAIEQTDFLIKELDATEPKSLWITDRIPTKGGWYLVTLDRKNPDVTDGFWTGSDWNTVTRVIAWMPKPEPFGGEHE